MNICILINSFNLGGAEKLMYDVAKQLTVKNYSVVVIAMKRAETELEHKMEGLLNEQGIMTDTVGKPAQKGRFQAVFKIRALLKKYKIKVLHTNGQSPDFYGRIAAAFCRGVKTVVTIHNTAGYSQKSEKLLGRFTDAYTAVSAQTGEYCKDGLGIEDFTVIDNGINVERYSKEPKEDSAVFYILSVGRVVPQKGYADVMVQMCGYLAENPDAVWYIVGETSQDPEYFGKVTGLIDESVKDRIIFTGAVTAPEEYYKKADCFILPSKFEGFGIAFIEAMAAGLPVICYKIGVIIDLENAGGTFVPLDCADISSCIAQAKSMSQEKLNFNYEFCKANYSLEAATDKYIDVYDSVI